MIKCCISIIGALCSICNGFAQLGPYHPGPGNVGTHAIHMDSSLIIGWAEEPVIERGYELIANPVQVTTAGSALAAGQKADGITISLGDSGVATYQFASPLADKPGYDIAIFENGFYSPADTGYFLEFAFVEVSSNGTDFFRFPSSSIKDTTQQVASYGVTDPTQYDGLAGKYTTGYGVPFDFSVLDTLTELDLTHIVAVRIVDVVGSVSPLYGQRASNGWMVNDPYPTEFAAGGFDLDALAILDQRIVNVPEPTASMWRIYPNPTHALLHLETDRLEPELVSILSLDGKVMWQKTVISNALIQVDQWPTGMYYMIAHSAQRRCQIITVH